MEQFKKKKKCYCCRIGRLSSYICCARTDTQCTPVTSSAKDLVNNKQNIWKRVWAAQHVVSPVCRFFSDEGFLCWSLQASSDSRDMFNSAILKHGVRPIIILWRSKTAKIVKYNYEPIRWGKWKPDEQVADRRVSAAGRSHSGLGGGPGWKVTCAGQHSWLTAVSLPSLPPWGSVLSFSGPGCTAGRVTGGGHPVNCHIRAAYKNCVTVLEY